VSDWADRQLARRGIGDELVLDAMRRVPRELFVPEHERALAYEDAALLLGYGQTISQPYMVALIAAALGVRTGDRVLDVGTGSGYQAAVLAELAGHVVSIERIPELRAGPRTSRRPGTRPRRAPDRQRLEAAARSARRSTRSRSRPLPPSRPPALVDQLAEDGRLVLPVGQSDGQVLEVVTRDRRVPCASVRFVPLVDYPR
jgi:protein-L-isoaspartate(D-aspartate) O-methyltransferase